MEEEKMNTYILSDADFMNVCFFVYFAFNLAISFISHEPKVRSEWMVANSAFSSAPKQFQIVSGRMWNEHLDKLEKSGPLDIQPKIPENQVNKKAVKESSVSTHIIFANA